MSDMGLIAGLLRPEAYAHPAPAPRLIETHISWVILAGEYAYKLKKPVDFGFLDFSSLDKRRHCCAEEIRLNRRLAPATYLDVVAVTGRADAPRMGGDGPVLEWAVRMRAFPADATLDHAPSLTPAQIDAIATRVASFHDEIPATPEDSAHGQAARIMAPVAGNFSQLRALCAADPADGARVLALLEALQAWTHDQEQRLAEHFAARRAAGFIRECHGDLHLGNIAWVDDAPLIFDGIEFSPALRHIDVISEIAFLTMDLTHRGMEPLAWRLLNRYLEHTGDYAGLAALPYYQVYRAMVRAKVAALRATQAENAGAECMEYLALARYLARPRSAALLLMHGVSGSGKSWLSQHLLQALGAIRLRSDIERKRLFGLAPLQDSRVIAGGIYTREAGENTLKRLLELSRALLARDMPVIVDATFIRRAWRAPFVALAQELALPWRIVAVQAAPEMLRARIAQRQAAGSDASEAGLEIVAAQLEALEPFDALEQAHSLCLRDEWRVEDALAGLADFARPAAFSRQG